MRQLFLAALLALHVSPTLSAQRPPNVVLIVADDLVRVRVWKGKKGVDFDFMMPLRSPLPQRTLAMQTTRQPARHTQRHPGSRACRGAGPEGAMDSNAKDFAITTQITPCAIL